MTSKIKDDVRITQMANGFLIEPDTDSVFSQSDCYVFQTFELMAEWLRQYYLDDELRQSKPFIVGSADPE